MRTEATAKTTTRRSNKNLWRISTAARNQPNLKMEATMTRNFDELLRHDVHSFANRAHVELHGSPLGDDMYVRLLTYDVERIVLGRIRRYVCNLPPGHGKTFLFSVTLPAWLLGHNP